MDPVADILFNYVSDVLYHPTRAKLNIESLPEDFRDLGQGLQTFSKYIMETRQFAKELSQGNLNCEVPSRNNEIAAPLKALHAALRHLTWQSQQVAKGDYKQRVDFMGDFSVAFNTMIEQLDQRSETLLGEIKRSEEKSRALEQSISLFEAITTQISQWIVVTDKETGEWLFENFPAINMLSEKLFEPRLHEWIKEQTLKMEMDKQQQAGELELFSEGVVQYFSADIHPLVWRGHNAVAFFLTDISAEKLHIRELEHFAYRDALTKVFNRNYGMVMLEKWLTEGYSFILCFVDMDYLKYVNDSFGHSVGDKYILSVTEELRSFSNDVIVCRLGGDEFMLLARDWTMREAEERMEALRDTLMGYDKRSSDMAYTCSISYGVIEVDGSNKRSASDLLSIADEKMYIYKRAHKAQRKADLV